ncbi:MAG: DUF896 domain-containing protein [Bacteroidota bacterium]
MPELKVIKRLNELYHKSQQEPLSPEELAERDRLRRIYLNSIKEQFKVTLDQIEIVDEAGNKIDPHGDGHKH